MNGTKHWAFALVILLALALRLAWGLAQSTNPANLKALPDQVEYLQTGQNLLSGKGLEFTDPRFGQVVWAYRTPGYPLLVAACGADLRVIRIVQAILDTSTVLAVYLLARVWLAPGRSTLAAFLAAVNPFLIFYSGMILTETLFVAMLLWGILILVRGGKLYWLGTALIALSILVRPSALLLPVLLAWLLKRPAWRPAIAGLVMTVAVLFPWALRNHICLGHWIWTSTNSGVTEYDGFNPIANGASNQSFLADMPQLKQMGEVERCKYLGGLAMQFIGNNPARSIELTFDKVGRFWSPIPLSEQFGSHLRYIAVGAIYEMPLFLLCLAGLASASIPRKAKLLILGPALYFTVIHAVSVSSMRYRIPAEPLLAVVAACCLDT
ncbi:MAG TPA: glycosyltransferase family 39 protein, partial [Tepidisphaeraceae bacterium]|nr:glycosyltransferase family 39 protein [Tepidisphaeraceae bacterium]